ncbi:hypothetical protein MNBD_UNCLBAC01-171 [hydrothermal vent metagenome]|uniref:Type II secretion system protein GspE N-terminal domain-containing protein n=1 Tax=hydrothermal vent metagenome TaxID=652676 RepID=A0A3B1D680_9ZZZZ
MKDLKKITRKQLGELLIERGIITHEQLNAALAYQKENQEKLVGEILVEMQFATEKDIAQALISQYNLPYLPIENYDIAEDIIQMIPKELCQQLTIIPIDKIGKNLTLAMANPLNGYAIKQVQEMTECIVQVFVSTTSEIKKSINKYYLSA